MCCTVSCHWFTSWMAQRLLCLRACLHSVPSQCLFVCTVYSPQSLFLLRLLFISLLFSPHWQPPPSNFTSVTISSFSLPRSLPTFDSCLKSQRVYIAFRSVHLFNVMFTMLSVQFLSRQITWEQKTSTNNGLPSVCVYVMGEDTARLIWELFENSALLLIW